MRKIVAIFEENDSEWWRFLALCDDQTVWRTQWDGHNRKWGEWHRMPLPPIPQDEEAPIEDDEPHGITGRC